MVTIIGGKFEILTDTLTPEVGHKVRSVHPVHSKFSIVVFQRHGKSAFSGIIRGFIVVVVVVVVPVIGTTFERKGSSFADKRTQLKIDLTRDNKRNTKDILVVFPGSDRLRAGNSPP
ncbi:hypothetical protein M0802_008152 [Mischocyttarus mexicanus]|nr:hypothetical protein M0802_008152 [Mischocyttarus mexicanus]